MLSFSLMVEQYYKIPVMKSVSIILLLIFSVALVFTACSKSETQASGNMGAGISFSCVGISPKFAADIQPVLITVCSINSNCHGAGSTNSGGAFTNHSEVSAKKSNIRAAILSGTMPQTGTLTQAQINAFICWIDSGGLNN